jgi:glycosyltransferase involved in cell wall biosynthesis
MKVGYIVHPGAYGLFSVYCNLRAGLKLHGIALRWVSMGVNAENSCRQPQWAGERQFGDIVMPESDDYDAIGRATVAYLAENKYDALVINPPQGNWDMNLVRYLPRSILRVMLVQMMGSGTYRLCRSLRDFVHATVGLSPRIADDLVTQYGFDRARTTSCAGLDLTPYQNLPPRQSEENLRLIYFGRITDGQKGILHLPTILNALRDEKVTLSIAGDGPDMAKLRKRLEPMSDRVRYLGLVTPPNIPEMLVHHDVFIFPTRYEGLGYVLLEALAAGCVPVCSRVRGVTDFVVRDGETGLLFPVDEPAAAAEKIRLLARDRAMLARLSAAGRADCRRFSADSAGGTWATLLRGLAAAPPPIADPLPLDRWAYPRAFNRGWRAYVPERFKNFIRASSAH